MRAALRPLAGAALVVAGLALLVLAVQLARWPGEAAAHDRRLLVRGVPEETAWGSMGGTAAGLLGARTDVRLRQAMVDFRRGRLQDAAGAKTTDRIVATVEASIGLGSLDRDPEASHAQRSHGLNLQAILIAEEAVFAVDGAPRVRRALELLRRAVRFDPRNDAAKANMELLLSLSGDGDVAEESTGGFGGFGEDSGAGDPGRGY